LILNRRAIVAVQLSEEQKEALQHLISFYEQSSSPYFVMHGLAGSGKTTVLAHMARLFPGSMLCTFTGKAASILRLKTGLDAMTIHSAFYQLKEEKVTRTGKRELYFTEAHREGQLSGNLVLLDECSMINENMAMDLIRTGAQVIACGDPGQLPPVEGKQFFKTPNLSLKTIHRQALESPIIRQAHAVRQGKPYVPDGDDFRVAKHGELTAMEKLDADIILCWTNATKRAINKHIRELRGYSMMPHPQAGEPVLCLRNAQEYGIFNGAIYTLLEPFMEGDTSIVLDVEGQRVTVEEVNFEGIKSGLKPGQKAATWFDFGYALTVHKAQGSEWSNVILIDEYRRREERKEWLYTGITRAAQKITIIR
jgi:exodeoxyribonuclease-5